MTNPLPPADWYLYTHPDQDHEILARGDRRVLNNQAKRRKVQQRWDRAVIAWVVAIVATLTALLIENHKSNTRFQGPPR